MPVASNRMQAEKEELDWLLTSGALGRSSNLARMLAFVCEKHFSGQEDQVTEPSVAIEALGRRGDFDPQTDTIVRVTAHSLRKRLQEIYKTQGANRPVHILIPLGHYVPSFIHQGASAQKEPARGASKIQNAMHPAFHAAARLLPTALSRWLAIAVLLASASLWSFFAFFAHHGAARAAMPAQGLPEGPPPPNSTIRALLGTGRSSYTDHSGYTWTPGRYCASGTSLNVSALRIVGTEDPYIYSGGIRGMGHCTFPVKPGAYEIHFYFAETSGLQPAISPALLSINAGADISFDVVDNAGGDGIATSYVATGIHPENDGMIHLDYTSEVSLLNAVEILPDATDGPLPVRIAAGPDSITDSSGRLWLSDRYFVGGRRGQVPNSAKTANRSIYSFDRVGSFRYDIPVATHGKYRVRLYFSEPWFGQHSLVNGGPGSRVFDVSCNGSLILKNFDILALGGNNPVIKTFDNIQPTGRGRIELSFLPVVNYPEVNAIEVLAEPSQ